jgi:uncharacterized damage-inducible protein DinB
MNALVVSCMDSRKLFEYSQAVRSRYLEQMSALPWAEVVKSRGASFDSLKNVFLHTVDAEDKLVNYVIAGRAKEWVPRNQDDFVDLDSVRNRTREVESKAKAYVASLKPEDLDRKVELLGAGGQSFMVRVEDVLVATALENIHHFGELIALMWQMDVDPSHMGWLSYLRK